MKYANKTPQLTVTCSRHGEQTITKLELHNYARTKVIHLSCGCGWRISADGRHAWRGNNKNASQPKPVTQKPR